MSKSYMDINYLSSHLFFSNLYFKGSFFLRIRGNNPRIKCLFHPVFI